MGNSVVTDVQFGHLFLVCIKYDALAMIRTGSYLWVIQKDITLYYIYSDRNKEIISLVRRTSATSKSLVRGSPHLSNK